MLYLYGYWIELILNIKFVSLQIKKMQQNWSVSVMNVYLDVFKQGICTINQYIWQQTSVHVLKTKFHCAKVGVM